MIAEVVANMLATANVTGRGNSNDNGLNTGNAPNNSLNFHASPTQNNVEIKPDDVGYFNPDHADLNSAGPSSIGHHVFYKNMYMFVD